MPRPTALLMVLMALGCSQRPLYLPLPGADLATSLDLAPAPDAGSDLAAASDLAMPDLATPDLHARELATTDLAPGRFALQPLTTYWRPYAPLDIAAGDFDGDGHADFAVNAGAGGTYRRELLFHRGRGDGSFAQAGRFPLAGGEAHFLEAVDLDGDGRPEIVAANRGAAITVQVFAGRKGALERIFNTRLASGLSADLLAFARVDADATLDALAVSGKKALLLPGRGDGSFGAPVESELGDYFDAFALGDLDEDGRADLVVGRFDRLVILRGRGDGRFGDAVTLAGAWASEALTLADLDGDRHLDLLVDSIVDQRAPQNARTWLLSGRGDGGFDAAAELGRTPSTRQGRIAIDLDGDGATDLVRANEWNQLAVERRAADGSWAEIPIEGAREAHAAAVADFDEDGRRDLIHCRYSDAKIGVALQRDGRLIGTTLSRGDRPSAAAVLDVDGDARADVVVVDGNGGNAIFWRGRGDGTLELPREIDHGSQPSLYLQVGDFDRDRRPDLLLSTAWVATKDPFPLLLRGGGDGSFRASAINPALRVLDGVGDFDGDGVLDLLQSAQPGVPTWFTRGLGDGSFAAPVATDALGASTAGAVADVNGDGKLDLIAHPYEFLGVALGRGDGSFSVLPRVPSSYGSRTLRIGDVNSDGKLDLVAGNNGRLEIWIGAGDGRFAAPTSRTIETWDELQLVDLDGDTRLDLVIHAKGGVGFVRGRGDASFDDLRLFAAPINPERFAIGDLDGDGRPDVVAIETNNNTLTPFLNRRE